MRRALLAIVVLLALTPSPAAAVERGECVVGVPGPVCHVWFGTVHTIGDGDTFDVAIDRDGTSARRRIRVVGVQAMEQSSYAASRRVGECHAVEATELTERLIRRGRSRVRLAARNPDSMSRDRLMRSVAVRTRNGWRDLGTSLVSRGLALWLPGWGEWSGNAHYRDLSIRALAGGRGLFAPDGCGAGPSPAASLRLYPQWDADGDDRANPSGEWVRVRNLDPVNPVGLGGWYLRDTSLRRYIFPPHATVAPNGSVTLNVGAEGDDQAVFGWGLRAPVFENATRDERSVGDGAYLFDPLGNVRAAAIYPCRELCPDPLAGAVGLAADARGGREQVTVTNLSAGPIDLDGHLLKSAPYSYAFGPATMLAPGESLRVRVVGPPDDDEPLLKHWGLGSPILRDAGDVVRLDSFSDLTLACAAWGDKTC